MCGIGNIENIVGACDIDQLIDEIITMLGASNILHHSGGLDAPAFVVPPYGLTGDHRAVMRTTGDGETFFTNSPIAIR